MDVVRVNDKTSAGDLADMLAAECHRAQREFPVVGTALVPTPWDKRHARLDALLGDWELASAKP